MEILAENEKFKVAYPKAYLIEWIVMTIVYFLLLILFLFITVVVIRKEEKPDKVLVTMLVCLQTSALSQVVLFAMLLSE